ncbi:protein SUPPRESSOR OF PHYA-105 1-like isoform X1 [Syzygium oleosum]|uniref:protein SUPPRESSOR OF PHYA-105 1-like isoform X1 n=1 Tax=Syzygium oleosum TaxID=219896 RepID=UPI0011D218D9|nr:protein SUPPRESSOR OF PHYA-105 1-like isoform X1 [Syzygium oleosum]XP_056160450.1 protein SUPPRESSOR OF PHYA-105 1-like isoform X1 [Syzygium oleosum]
MELPAEKRFAFSVSGNGELGRRQSDKLLMPEDRFLDPYMKNKWPETSSRSSLDNMDEKDPRACVTSSSCSEPPITAGSANFSVQDARPVVEELTVENMHQMALSSGHIVFRQRQLQHLPQMLSRSLGSQDSSPMMARVSEENVGMPSHLPVQKPLLIREIDEQMLSSEQSREAEKIVKGKGIFSCSADGVKNWEPEKLITEAKVASPASLEVIPSTDKPSLHGVNKSGLGISHDGTNLRELLRPGYRKINKLESLQLFRQIVELVDFAHSQGVVLLDLRPSRFVLLSLNKIRYIGSSANREAATVLNQDLKRKRPWKQGELPFCVSGEKQHKLGQDTKALSYRQFSSSQGFGSQILAELDPNVTGCPESTHTVGPCNTNSSHQIRSVLSQLEERWYTSPEELTEMGCIAASNIYSLGILLFELLCCFESWEAQCVRMLDLSHRILPPSLLSENPKEAGFCLWLLHPEYDSRPKTREILQSELLRSSKSHELHQNDHPGISTSENDAESELLLHFLVSLKAKKLKDATKLAEDIRHIEEDLKEMERRSYSLTSSLHSEMPTEFLSENLMTSGILRRPYPLPTGETNLPRNLRQLEDAYFFVRSQSQTRRSSAAAHPDEGLLSNRERWSGVWHVNQDLSVKQMPSDLKKEFYDGLCKFARYSKFEARGALRSGDLLNSANVIRSIGFDRDEDYIAAAGVSKKIKIYEFAALLDDSIDLHYPAVEMSNNSKLSCVCWNSYMRNYLASTDYDGTIKIWDVGTAQGFSQHMEHQKRAWSVDFSRADPTKFASGSDDCSLKLWAINEKNSVGTIWNPANVCCVQFSPHSTNLLVFGCADNKIYCYDLRHTQIPWCTLAGHGKTVSYIKFLDSESIVSASTDNTLKLWDLKKANSDGLSSNACTLTYRGHTNEKNFVGLSTMDGYIACGSETNELFYQVYSFYRSLPMPITSHAFGSSDPISGTKIGNDDGNFVSSVCWGQKTNMVVAANSAGSLKILQMV